MKVLHIINSLEVGGLEKFILALSDCYSSSVDSYFVCLSKKGDLYAESNNKIFFLGKSRGLSIRIIRKMIKLINKIRPDIVHTHNQAPQLYGSLACLISNIPVVHTKHGRNEPHLTKRIMLDKFSSFLTKAVVPVSSDAVDVCKNVIGIHPQKIRLILNGINTDNFSPGGSGGLRRQLDMKEGCSLIGIVARLFPEKSHSTLIEACDLLRAKRVPFRLAIIGDGPERDKLEALVDQLKLKKEIVFLGTRHDVPSLVKDLDLKVLCSTTEGTSLTLLEAMSCGIPVVATDVGGNPEVVIDGVTGILVPPQNPVALAAKIQELLGDPSLLKRMGKAGRDRVVREYSLEKAAKKYVDLYHELLNKK